jgi:glyoxylase-like metal-dependent hydrolase (beta-lactamase superfamily II)
MQTNCLFVETGSERILIETGMGEKWTEKQAKIYDINRQKTFADSLIEKTGYKSEDITIVVNTHLHLDHAGGNTRNEECGMRNADLNSVNPHSSIRIPHSIVPAFPNARYFVSETEYEHAEKPTMRDRGSYIADDWRPLLETGQLELKPENYEVAPGLTMQQMRGHNGSMQTVKIASGGETFYSFADLIPMTAHLPLAWIMGYDLFPLETLENKKKLLPQAVKERWLCFFYHDPETPLCRLTEENGKIKAVSIGNV